MTTEQSPQPDDVSDAIPGDVPEPGEVVLYDPDLASLRLNTGGREISVAGLARELVFQRVSGDDPPRWALFTPVGELDVLAKMVAYVLDTVKISGASKAALTALLPRVEALQERTQSVAVVGWRQRIPGQGRPKGPSTRLVEGRLAAGVWLERCQGE